VGCGRVYVDRACVRACVHDFVLNWVAAGRGGTRAAGPVRYRVTGPAEPRRVGKRLQYRFACQIILYSPGQMNSRRLVQYTPKGVVLSGGPDQTWGLCATPMALVLSHVKGMGMVRGSGSSREAPGGEGT
jgi:hypothetical protein